MNYGILLSIFCLILQVVSAPPPRRSKSEEEKLEKHETDDIKDFGLEYNRYLKEVVELLESDPEFKKKLEDAQEADIRSGKIAQELEFVDHKVRTKLDEVKRQELERLRHLAQKQFELSNGLDTEHLKISSEHLDEENPHTFGMKDLKMLIAKVSADLVKADEKRRQEFKEYEMQKEFERQEKLKHLDKNEREAFEKQLQENETKHKQHEPLHQPGSKQQLEEVWEKQDHMENQEFDPKVFFQLHDLDGNGVWDQNEVKILFLKELDKMYEQGAPEDDMRERAEEMERMREHVFNETDRNRDGLISFDEFLYKTMQPDFEKDQGWESIDQKPVYTYDEYKEFERKRQEEVQRLIQQGLIPPQPVYPPQYGYHQPPPAYGHPQEQYHKSHHQEQPYQASQHRDQNPQGFNQNQYQRNYQNVGQQVNQEHSNQGHQLQKQHHSQDPNHVAQGEHNQFQQKYQQQSNQFSHGYQQQQQYQQFHQDNQQQNHQLSQNYQEQQQQQQQNFEQNHQPQNQMLNQYTQEQKIKHTSQEGYQQNHPNKIGDSSNMQKIHRDSNQGINSDGFNSNLDYSKMGTIQKTNVELNNNLSEKKDGISQPVNNHIK